MQTLFCSECGHKMTYSGAKPKFCSSCGTPIGKVSPDKPAAATAPKRRRVPSFREQMDGGEQTKGDEGTYEGDDDDETDIDYVPDIRRLEYTISNDNVGNKTHKLSDLLDVSSEQEEIIEKPKKRRGRPRKKAT